MSEVELSEKQEEQIEEMTECIDRLVKVVEDVLPQMGKIVIQDYENLNLALMMSRKYKTQANV